MIKFIAEGPVTKGQIGFGAFLDFYDARQIYDIFVATEES